MNQVEKRSAAKAFREWIAAMGAKTAYIIPGGPWKNGYCESFKTLKPARDSRPAILK